MTGAQKNPMGSGALHPPNRTSCRTPLDTELFSAFTKAPFWLRR